MLFFFKQIRFDIHDIHNIHILLEEVAMFPFSGEELEKGELISVFTVLSVPREDVWKSPTIVRTLKTGLRPAVCAALSGQEGVGVRKAR